MPITQLAKYAATAFLGPPLFNGERGPYPSWPDGQVKVRWVRTFQVREYGNGRKEPVPGRGETYRPFFELSYEYLENILQSEIWNEIKNPPTGILKFAPYSYPNDEGGHDPVPAEFDVLPPEEIPDTADLVLARFPFGLVLEGMDEYLKTDIPTVGDVGTLPPPIPSDGGCAAPNFDIMPGGEVAFAYVQNLLFQDLE